MISYFAGFLREAVESWKKTIWTRRVMEGAKDGATPQYNYRNKGMTCQVLLWLLFGALAQRCLIMPALSLVNHPMVWQIFWKKGLLGFFLGLTLEIIFLNSINRTLGLFFKNIDYFVMCNTKNSSFVIGFDSLTLFHCWNRMKNYILWVLNIMSG